MKYGILIHEPNDDVGVAVIDLQAGTTIGTANLEGEELGLLEIVEDIPLGHKVALHNLLENKHVIEYGRPIGRATQTIASGTHVHVHNLQTLRWAQ
jgi:altronate dehydratase